MMSIDDYIAKIAIPSMYRYNDLSRAHMLESYLNNAPISIHNDTYLKYLKKWYDVAKVYEGYGHKVSRSFEEQRNKPSGDIL